MAFGVKDYHDFLRLLHEHPEWKTEMRSVLLTDNLLTLPQIVRELAEAQKRTEARVEELAEAQKRTEARMEELAEAQKRTESQLSGLIEAQKHTDSSIKEMTLVIRHLTEGLAKHEGWYLEWKYSQRAASYFGVILKKVKLADVIDLEDQLQAKISKEEFQRLLKLDVLVSGIPRDEPEYGTIWLAVEVSSVIDKEDIFRAQDRAAILRKSGMKAVPVVAGEAVTMGAKAEVDLKTVLLIKNGSIENWPEVLQLT